MSVDEAEGRQRGQFEVAGAGVLHKAMSVVDAVSAAGRPVRISDLVDATGLPLGTLHRLLSALVSERLVKQDARNKSYSLGSRLAEIASSARDSIDVAKLVESDIEQLNGATGESIAVALVEGDQVIYRAKRDGLGLLRISLKIGERQPLHASAVGKAVLAFMDPDQFRKTMRRLDLTPFTAKTSTDHASLAAELADIRSRGWAMEDEEHFAGVRSISAPITDRRGYAIGAVAIIGPAVNLTSGKIDSSIASLIDCAQQVSVKLGGDPPSLNPVSPDPGAIPAQLELRLRAPAYLGSSPLWDERNDRLYWLDVLAPSINIFEPATGNNVAIPMEDLACGMGLHADENKLVVALRTRIGVFDLDTRQFSHLVSASPDRFEHRFNKGGCDGAGRFWTSDMHMGGLPAAGSLFRLEPDGTLRTMDTGLTLPNALAWSPDNRVLYLTDSAARTIYAYDYDLASGELGERRALVKIAPDLGRPAGLSVDSSGCLWSTHTDGWRITRYAPDGEILAYFSLPVPSANGCGFGDKGLQTLYITTARDRLSPRRLVDAPLSGSIFSYRPGATGLKPFAFGIPKRS